MNWQRLKNPTSKRDLIFTIIKYKMKTLFESLKWIFFFMAVIVWLIFLRWEYLINNSNCNLWEEKLLCLINESTYKTLLMIIMPLFLVLSWIMIWYIISTVWLIRSESDNEETLKKIYIQSFIIWLICWVVLATIYIFLKQWV